MSTSELPAFPAPHDARCPLDPPPEYRRWREDEGLRRVLWEGRPAWAVSRYADVRAALTDPRISAEVAEQQSDGGGMAEPPKVFPRMDDPEHAVLRRMLTRDFTVRRINAMRPEIEKMAHGFIDEMVAAGSPADLVQAYALPIPSLVISLLLGVPYSDHQFFQEVTGVLMSRTATEQERQDATFRFFGYLVDLVAAKESAPDDALVSRLVQEYLPSGQLTRETIAMNCFILLVAGHETTANMIGLSTVALLERPELAARLRDTDPTVIANAVEELLRYLTIVHSLVVRVAKEDAEIGGQRIAAGELLVMNLPAANRDPAFLDDPDTLDIDRATRAHVSFGHGTHLCLGATLARAELEIALPVLLRRLPDLRLAAPVEDVRFRDDMSIYGVHELPVSWG